MIQDKLKAVLDKQGIQQGLQDHMVALSCDTLEAFANWCGRDEIKANILDGCQAFKDDKAQLARLKMAWRVAEAKVTRDLERSSRGIEQEDLDEPLDEQVATGVWDTFKKAYGWRTLAPEKVGTDSLLGRIFREFQGFKPTLLPLTKVKTLASANSIVGPPLKKRIAEGVTINLDRDYEGPDVDCAGNFYLITKCLSVLASTWAVAGAYEVDFGGQRVKFAYWADIMEYADKVMDEAGGKLATYQERSVIQYFITVEEALRTKAIALTRGDQKMPWGLALKEAISANATLWDHQADMLLKKSSGSGGDDKDRQIVPYMGGGRGKGKGKGKDSKGQGEGNKDKGRVSLRGTDYRRNWKTAKYDGNGKVICKPFNDPRGCKKDCPNWQEQVSYAVLMKGALCGAKDHGRWGHKVDLHGAVRMME